MSTIIAELYDALRSAGVSEQQARAAAAAVLPAGRESDLATKGDLHELGAATQADLAELRADLAELSAATKAELAELSAATKGDFAGLKAELTQFRAATQRDLAELEARLIKWNVGTIIAVTAVFAAIIKLL